MCLQNGALSLEHGQFEYIFSSAYFKAREFLKPRNPPPRGNGETKKKDEEEVSPMLTTAAIRYYYFRLSLRVFFSPEEEEAGGRGRGEDNGHREQKRLL